MIICYRKEIYEDANEAKYLIKKNLNNIDNMEKDKNLIDKIFFEKKIFS